MDNINIELAAFSFGTQAQNLKQVFRELGCKIKDIDIEKSLAGITGAGNALKVVFLNSQNYPRKKLLKFLSQYKHVPKLGIFPCQEIERDNELVNQFNDFVNWPCNTQELSLRLKRLCFEASAKTQQENDNSFIKSNLIGQSRVFVDTIRQITQVATYDAPVLIEGETGTGKELAARAIHYQSHRQDYPFIPVNCGALPDSLIENELFGHVKGAFTDARSSQAGLVAQAEGGTLFLDEVDSLSAKGQVVLLRFLQDLRYRSLGDETIKQANVRVIVASNKSLLDYVAEQRFREDLFYRLNVLYLRIPSLRERTEDIAILAKHFVDKLKTQYQLGERDLSPALYRKLTDSDWPGNVRQLENYVHREMLMMTESETVMDNSVQPRAERRKRVFDRREDDIFKYPFNEAKARIITRFEKKYLMWLMQETDGNVTRAARKSGKERRALGKLLKKHGIDKHLEV